jgi:tetratricopeptide (TPR) repeat protein
MRGYLWLRTGNLDKAKSDIDKSLDLEPTENWPYLWGVSIALRQGRLADAQQYIHDAFIKFPDPDAAENWAILVASENKNPVTPMLSAFWSWNLGQFNKAIQKAQSVESVDLIFTDAYLVEGLSYCNLGKLAEAEAAYTKAIELEPNFALLYMLRADVYKQQGYMTAALGDFYILQQSTQAAQMKEYIQAAQNGRLNCKNFSTFTP